MTIVVTAAVIERDGSFLVTRRQSGVHLAGFWEFPGGKCEAGEDHAACLARELREELGVGATVGDELFATMHTYRDRSVELHFLRCKLDGEPTPVLTRTCQGLSPSVRATVTRPTRDLSSVWIVAVGAMRSGSGGNA